MIRPEKIRKRKVKKIFDINSYSFPGEAELPVPPINPPATIEYPSILKNTRRNKANVLQFADHANLVPGIRANCKLLKITNLSMVSRPSLKTPSTDQQMEEFAQKLAKGGN
jgi:hypothetical protein